MRTDIRTITNKAACKDSHAPDTVAAWDDHFIVQTKPPAAVLWGSAACTVSADAAKRAAAQQSQGILLVRIVKPSRKIGATA